MVGVTPSATLSLTHRRNSCSVFRHASDVAGGARAASRLEEREQGEPITRGLSETMLLDL